MELRIGYWKGGRRWMRVVLRAPARFPGTRLTVGSARRIWWL